MPSIHLSQVTTGSFHSPSESSELGRNSKNSSGADFVWPNELYFNFHWLCWEPKQPGKVRWALTRVTVLRVTAVNTHGRHTYIYIHEYNQVQCNKSDTRACFVLPRNNIRVRHIPSLHRLGLTATNLKALTYCQKRYLTGRSIILRASGYPINQWEMQEPKAVSDIWKTKTFTAFEGYVFYVRDFSCTSTKTSPFQALEFAM